MMDVETANSTAAKGGSGLPRIFAAASTFVSCLALAGVFVLVLQNQKLQSQMDGLQQQAPQSADGRQNDAQKEIARREVHDMVQSHLRAGRATATSTSYNCPHERTHSFFKDCTDSPRTPGSVRVPKKGSHLDSLSFSLLFRCLRPILSQIAQSLYAMWKIQE
jgi:hypothetical protein